MREYFFDTTFLAKLDSDPNLIAFTNGVWDLKKGLFRSACPDDNLSISTGYDYLEQVNQDDKSRVQQYWKSLHPEPEERVVKAPGSYFTLVAVQELSLSVRRCCTAEYTDGQMF
mmetsp:Transcript_15054/g.26156  ORF Transcript_15054/g.26156 Transcript_15054/m.26156 type:complete len:114 (-) Transcript_15054:473-814(-)